MRKLIKKWVEGTKYEPLAIALRELSMGKGERLGRRDDRLLKLLMSYILKEDSNCIDVGAHKGDMLSDMYRLSPNGQHYAFEPLPDLAMKLKERFPNVFEIALSDEEGMVEFYRNVIDPGYSGLKQGVYKKGQNKVELITVQTRRLDDILPPDLKVDFIKIDVEGAELQVMRGAERTIKTHQPYIVLEHGARVAPYYGITSEMVYEFLVENCKMHLFLMDGQGPLGKEDFLHITDKGLAWNFIARP